MLHAAGAVLKRYRQNVRSKNVPNNRSLASSWWACHTPKGSKPLLAVDFAFIESNMRYMPENKLIEGIVRVCDAEERQTAPMSRRSGAA
jgi:hypothetical protein